jgi:hypothetical protein
MPQPKQHCERRDELAEGLVDLAIRLSIAAVEMARVAGASDDEVFVRAKVEMERLRDESEAVRTELTHHRLKHGC